MRALCQQPTRTPSPRKQERSWRPRTQLSRRMRRRLPPLLFLAPGLQARLWSRCPSLQLPYPCRLAAACRVSPCQPWGHGLGYRLDSLHVSRLRDRLCSVLLACFALLVLRSLAYADSPSVAVGAEHRAAFRLKLVKAVAAGWAIDRAARQSSCPHAMHAAMRTATVSSDIAEQANATMLSPLDH